VRILNPQEREAAERRREEIVRELAELPVERSAAEAARAAGLEQEQAALERKLHGIGPPRAT
jgi:hypothetical protein